MEVGSFSTSYIPTVGATMIRQADVFYVGTTAPSQGTFFTEYMPYTTPATHTVMAYTNSAGNYNAGYGSFLEPMCRMALVQLLRGKWWLVLFHPM